MDIIISLLLGLIGLYFLYKVTGRPKNFPPGPWPRIPIIGHMHLFIKDSLKSHAWAREKYGNIVGLYLGSLPNVIIHDPQLLKEAFNNPKIQGRPDLPIFNEASDGKNGIIAADGTIWAEQRRFTLRHLRDFGFAKASMESLIHEEVVELIGGLSKEVGRPIDMKHRFGIVVLNSVWRLVTGQRFSHMDPKLNELMKKFNEGFEEQTGAGSLSIFLPWLTKTFPTLTRYKRFSDAVKAPFPFYREQINSHKETHQSGHSRDFLDAYIEEMKNTVDVNSSFYGSIGDKQLIAVVHDLFTGGSETTSVTLTWLILYLATYPEVQEKLHEEIKSAIGLEKLPSLSDRIKLSYVDAVVNETLRCSSLVPFGVMHQTTDDVELQGYFLPKGTTVNGFLFGIHHSKNIWGDPENFRPERFLDADGKFKKHESLLAFSTGKRSCPGETFARDQLFLISSGLFQRFLVRTNPDEPKPSLEHVTGMLNVPRPFTVVFEDRLVQ